jgi:hypothetical protein
LQSSARLRSQQQHARRLNSVLLAMALVVQLLVRSPAVQLAAAVAVLWLVQLSVASLVRFSVQHRPVMAFSTAVTATITAAHTKHLVTKVPKPLSGFEFNKQAGETRPVSFLAIPI